MKLYELSTNYNTLVDILERATDEDPKEAVRDTLDMIHEEIEYKAENIAKIIAQYTAEQKAIESEIERLSKKNEQISRNKERLKSYLEESLIRCNMEKFKTPLFSFLIRNNPPAVAINDLCLVPQEFIIKKETLSVDKKAIAEKLKRNEIVKGCHLTYSKTLVIK